MHLRTGPPRDLEPKAELDALDGGDLEQGSSQT